jgi:hypothetical protein
MKGEIRMRTLKRFLARAIGSILRQPGEERMQEEIEAHLTQLRAENLRAGLSPAKARRLAVLKFGSVETTKEDYRDQRGLPFLETVLQDMRYALRRLRKTRVFTLTATLTLALGIGATTSIFTLVDAVLLKSLPVSNPDQLVRLGKAPNCCVQGGYFRGNDYSLVSMSCIRIFGTIPRTLRKWRPFRLTVLLWGFGARTMRMRPRATSENSYRAIISRCSA